MKIYLMADVSRISGILGGGNGLPPWYWFPELEKDVLRRKMTQEINKAAKTAGQAGATEIFAHEACPIDILTLDKNVKLIRGGSRLYLDESFSGIAFIGQGIAKNLKSSKGIESNIRKIEFNGAEVDEMTICALYAASIGVPTLCASGESGCIKNTKRFMPDLIEHANSKHAMICGMKISGLRQNLYMPQRSKAASFSSHSLSALLPRSFNSLLCKVDITFHFGSGTLAEMHARLPNVVRTDKITTIVHTKNMQEAFDAYCSSGLAASVDWLDNPNIHKQCRN